ncbi:sensor histidine kinase [Hymenobacter sp. IS2118]|uniref:sensor histidine kinase n=1 Tax=Hymenobacter sp. IS2118 TaxID=1505605 RepID=UPI0005582900|nr:sensor histidine kinase [Hymenobacter sp. IS2118]
MDKPEELDFMQLLGTGVVMMLLLVLLVVVFVIVHQKRAHLLQAQLRQQELSYQSSMLEAMVASQESERERIAQDLHDEIGASLSAARLFITQVHYEAPTPHLQEMSQQASQILGETLQNVRSIAQNLSPALLERFGLCRAVTTLGSRLEAAGLHVELNVDEAVETLGSSAQLALYRIVQELFANVVRHAGARCLTLHLQAAAGQLRLEVTDDGCGFVRDAPAASRAAGMGLAGIQARTKLLNGQLEISSVPGQGTRVILVLPH